MQAARRRLEFALFLYLCETGQAGKTRRQRDATFDRACLRLAVDLRPDLLLLTQPLPIHRHMQERRVSGWPVPQALLPTPATETMQLQLAAGGLAEVLPYPQQPVLLGM